MHSVVRLAMAQTRQPEAGRAWFPTAKRGVDRGRRYVRSGDGDGSGHSVGGFVGRIDLGCQGFGCSAGPGDAAWRVHDSTSRNVDCTHISGPVHDIDDIRFVCLADLPATDQRGK